MQRWNSARRQSVSRLSDLPSRRAVCEGLESRTLFAIAYPTPTEQYLIEVINRARANPIAEVLADSAGTTFTPLAQTGWVATASSTSESPANAVDGDLNTRWSSGAVQANGQFFQVDLGSQQTFNTLNMDAGPSTSDYPRGYSVYVSNTGTDWDTQPAVAKGVGIAALTTAGFATQTAQFVRIVQTGSNPNFFWSIAELNIGTATNPGWAGAPDLNEGMPAGTIPSTPAQPLAVDPYLTDAAQKHSAWGAPLDVFSHNEPDPTLADPTTRAVTAGFNVTNSWKPFYVGENISVGGIATDLTSMVLAANQGLFVDANENAAGPGGIQPKGHRLQMMNSAANLVGVGVATGTTNNFTLTEDFNNSNLTYLTGVTYNDTNSNSFYDPGEGLGGVTITATRVSDQQAFTYSTWAAGGYTLALTPGVYTVTATGGGIGTPVSQTVTITTQNVKSDFLQTNVAPPPPAVTGPTILQQPTSVQVSSTNVVTYSAKGPATFTVGATGTPTPTYQWQVSVNSGAFTNLAGATSAVLTFTPTADQNGNQYQCLVTNSQGTVISNVASLTLTGVGTYITKAPASQTANVGDTITLTSVASGFNPTITWESLKAGPGSNYTTITGATSPNYTFTVDPSMAGGVFFYRVTYNNSQIAGQNDSRVGIITVNAAPAAPVVTGQPQATDATGAFVPVAAVRAAQAGTATLSTLYTAFPAATVQWQVASGTVGGQPNFVDVSGLTGATVTFSVNASSNGNVYRAVISNAAGVAYTNAIKLRVNGKAAAINELTNLGREAKAALAAINGCAKVTAHDAKVLSADLKRLKATKTQKALVATLLKTDKANRALLRRNEARTLAALKRDAAHVVKYDAALTTDPTNTVLQGKLQTALAALQADVDTNTVPADATQCHLGVLGSLDPLIVVAPEDGILQTDIASAGSNANNIGQQLQAPMTLALAIIARINTNA